MRCRFALALLFVAAPAAPVAAYDLMGVAWSDDAIPVPYVVHQTLSDDLTDAESLEGIQMGYNAWSVLPCSSMRWQYAGRTQNRAWGADDGENVVTFLNDFWDDSGDTLAITMTMWGGWGDSMSDADIKFNGVWHRWAQFDGTPAGGADATDLASVATHEVGHALGLNHSGVGEATMWPSVGPGDANPRTLSADDIAGACAIYPTGQPAPRPDELPPPSPGTEPETPDAPVTPEPGPPPALGGFGEDCTAAECSPELMCITDRTGATFCSRACSEDTDCGDGYWCAPLAGGLSACARGQDDRPGLAGLGETCGRQLACAAGLRCIADAGENYCVQDCGADALCPESFACAALASGRRVCVRAQNGLPGTGEPCADDGRCAVGLICLSDAGRRYCTRTCAGDDCGPGAACVAIDPEGMACRLLTPETGLAPEAPVLPEGAPPTLGAPCKFSPGRPACEVGLACVDTVVLDGSLVEPGYCTVSCDATHCCPAGWGCTLDVGGRGRCRMQTEDTVGLECAPATPGTAADRPTAARHQGSDTFGCAGTPLPLLLLLLLGRRRRSGAREIP